MLTELFKRELFKMHFGLESKGMINNIIGIMWVKTEDIFCNMRSSLSTVKILFLEQ